MPIRVLQVLPDLSAGGAEGFATNLAVSQVENGAEVRFLLMAGVRDKRGEALCSDLHQAGIEVIGAREHNVRSPMNLVRLVSLINSWHPNVVHAHLYSAEVLVAVARAISLRGDVCYTRTLHSTDICENRSPRLVRLIDRFYQQVIACSPIVSEAYRNFMGNKQRSTLNVISNGSFLREDLVAKEEKLNARETLAIPLKAFVVAHIGRMSAGNKKLDGGLETDPKAHDVLIKAFAQVFKSNPLYILLLVGDGPLRSEVEWLVKSLGLADQTRFLGQQPEPWTALKAADVFCFPSRKEGLPTVLLEAASCGLPIVTSDIPEIRYLCPGNAWLLKSVNDVKAFANGLLLVRSNLEHFKRLADGAAQEIKEKFSMEICAEKYLSTYSHARGKAKHFAK